MQKPVSAIAALTAAAALVSACGGGQPLQETVGVPDAPHAAVACFDYNGNTVYTDAGTSGYVSVYSSIGSVEGTIDGRKFSAMSGGGCILESYKFDPSTPQGAALAQNARNTGSTNVVITNGAGNLIVAEFKTASNADNINRSGYSEMALEANGVNVGKIQTVGLSVFANQGESRFIRPPVETAPAAPAPIPGR